MIESRETIESKLTHARAQRGAALADGKKYDSAIIQALETQLASLDDVAQERERRQREASQALYDKNIAAQRAKLEALVNDDLLDTQAAQEATMTLAACFSRKLERITTMSKLAYDIS